MDLRPQPREASLRLHNKRFHNLERISVPDLSCLCWGYGMSSGQEQRAQVCSQASPGAVGSCPWGRWEAELWQSGSKLHTEISGIWGRALRTHQPHWDRFWGTLFHVWLKGFSKSLWKSLPKDPLIPTAGSSAVRILDLLPETFPALSR